VSPLQSNYLRCRLFPGMDRGDVLQRPMTRIRHKNTLYVQAVALKNDDGIMAASSGSVAMVSHFALCGQCHQFGYVVVGINKFTHKTDLNVTITHPRE